IDALTAKRQPCEIAVRPRDVRKKGERIASKGPEVAAGKPRPWAVRFVDRLGGCQSGHDLGTVPVIEGQSPSLGDSPRLQLSSPVCHECRSTQNNPTIRPSGPTSMASAAGTLGRPGMVMISPQIATTNSAPAESRTSRTLIV